jgi:DNA-binding NarL/FixJ family response regulator
MNPDRVARLLICTNENLYGLGLKAALEPFPDLKVVALIDNPSVVADQFRHSDCTVVIWDFDLPPHLMRPVLGDLRRQRPDCGVVAWMQPPSVHTAAQLLDDGARAILPKGAAIGMIVDALRAVAGGGVWLEPSMAAAVRHIHAPRLTKREEELMRLVAAGLSNKRISAELNITEGTVKVYLSRLFQKLGLEGRLELAMYAVRHFGVSLAERHPAQHASSAR